jgi:membrane-bound lytic murein transglycosylase A
VTVLVGGKRAITALLPALALAACVSPSERAQVSHPAAAHGPATAPSSAKTAVEAGVLRGPDADNLPIASDGARAALAAFRTSCRVLVKRADRSGLTRGDDWRPACDAAPGWPDERARAFFGRYFETAQVGEGKLFATGYYEPEIVGVRAQADGEGQVAPPPLGYDVPVYRTPNDMIEADLGLFAPDLKGRKIKGRVDNGKLVPYYDRGQIDDGALRGRGLEIGWVQDPVEFFFLQIQGSGRLIAPDGSVMRIGYAGQNGQAYVAIGKLLKERGVLGPGQTTMQGVVEWLRANLDEGRAVMRENKSYVFFKEIVGAGPIGALGVPVVGHVSLAADPAFTPLGGPVWLQSADHDEATGLWVAQDTGGAIKGANRFDTFWGSGPDARRIAGGMSGHGLAYLLLPVGTIERLSRGGAVARP